MSLSVDLGFPDEDDDNQHGGVLSSFVVFFNVVKQC